MRMIRQAISPRLATTREVIMLVSVFGGRGKWHRSYLQKESARLRRAKGDAVDLAHSSHGIGQTNLRN